MGPEARWKKQISRIKAEVKETGDLHALKERFKDAFIDSVRKNAKKRFGVLFSGGVDSSLVAFVAKKFSHDFRCYAVGLENSRDLEGAEKAALLLGLRLKTRVFSLDEAKSIIEAVAAILKEPNPVQVGVGSVVYAAAGLAAGDNTKFLFSGLGAENLSAGYDYHIKAKDANSACWKSLLGMWQQDLKRDFLISRSLGTNFFFPFLDKQVICLPWEIAFRKKVAAQYGSGFDRALHKVARLGGFKYKKDYLKSLV